MCAWIWLGGNVYIYFMPVPLFWQFSHVVMFNVSILEIYVSFNVWEQHLARIRRCAEERSSTIPENHFRSSSKDTESIKCYLKWTRGWFWISKVCEVFLPFNLRSLVPGEIKVNTRDLHFVCWGKQPDTGHRALALVTETEKENLFLLESINHSLGSPCCIIK